MNVSEWLSGSLKYVKGAAIIAVSAAAISTSFSSCESKEKVHRATVTNIYCGPNGSAVTIEVSVGDGRNPYILTAKHPAYKNQVARGGTVRLKFEHGTYEHAVEMSLPNTLKNDIPKKDIVEKK